MNADSIASLKSARGMTLIEVMVAMFILAVVSTMTANVLFSSVDVRSTLNLSSAELEELQVSLQWVRRDVENHLQRLKSNQRGQQSIGIGGDQHSLELIRSGGRSLDLPLDKTRPVRVRYEYKEGELLRKTSLRLYGTGDADWHTDVLTKNLTALEFRFHQGNRQQTQWSFNASVPDAVSVSLSTDKYQNVEQWMLLL